MENGMQQPKLMDMGDKGKIHSNIPNNKRLVVIDVNSKRIVGEVQYPVDEIFLFGVVSGGL